MSNERPNPKNDVYDHDSDNLAKAVGFTNKQHDELIEKMNEITHKARNQSEVVEGFAKEFTKKELAFAVLTTTSGGRLKQGGFSVEAEVVDGRTGERFNLDDIDSIEDFLGKLRSEKK